MSLTTPTDDNLKHWVILKNGLKVLMKNIIRFIQIN